MSVRRNTGTSQQQRTIGGRLFGWQVAPRSCGPCSSRLQRARYTFVAINTYEKTATRSAGSLWRGHNRQTVERVTPFQAIVVDFMADTAFVAINSAAKEAAVCGVSAVLTCDVVLSLHLTACFPAVPPARPRAPSATHGRTTSSPRFHWK